ncbi:MAG: hypothetical protein CVU00_04400 [Bacteroidetes bacterium HGW-Bacteroidetes-17]|jgi:GLPGLI family protein|nr:MAG: hypothetical protein CVU00_04400 [Bacteroidetes bacterium HGW-Bacteroidetes-17]
MKNILLFIIIILSIQTHAQFYYEIDYTQLDEVKLIAYYSIKYKHDSTNLHIVREENMILLLGEHLSYYTNYRMYQIKEDTRHFTSLEQSQQYYLKPNLSAGRFRYTIFKNYPKDKITFIEKVIDWLKYEEELNLFDWKLLSDTSTIAGYKVQKASCDYGGRSWVAWFSPEIPFNDGPYKFNGLPGLILKIYDTRLHYVFEIKNIEKPDKSTPIELEERDYYQTHKFNYFKAKDSFRENIRSYGEAAGLNKTQLENAVINRSLQNNPIELKQK